MLGMYSGGPDNLFVRVAQQQEGEYGAFIDHRGMPRRLMENQLTLLCLRHPDNELSGPPKIGID